jgi:hypothetical protein
MYLSQMATAAYVNAVTYWHVPCRYELFLARVDKMRTVLLVILIVLAGMAWVSMSWTADADTKSVRERFDQKEPAAPQAPAAPAAPAGMSADEKKKAVVADVMDIYKDLYGKYPATEYLVHYRDLAASLTREELRARIKSDGGTPPGVKAPPQEAEAQVAAMKPPAPGDKPILPAAMKPGPDTALPVRIMNIAMQLSALSEELQAADRAAPGAPKAFESFISFRT